MLTARYAANLAELLLPRETFHPFPIADARAAWDAVPDEVRRQAIAAGEQYLEYAWPALPVTLYLDYQRTGNRANYEMPYFQRRSALAALVLAECLEGQGRFLDDIINGIWSLCEESTWVIPAHGSHNRKGNPLLPETAAPTIDLFAAETGAQLVLTHYLLQQALDVVHPLVSARIRHEVEERILAPYLSRDFGWMGLHGERVNNWNPWIHSNVLVAQLLLDSDPARRIAGVAKVLRTLDVFIGIHHADGGCDEGPGYWGRAGASLFECLELLHGASNGQIDIFGEPLIRNILRYIYRVHISGDNFINFADCAPRLRPQGALLRRMGARINDHALTTFGAAMETGHFPDAQVRGSSLLRLLPAFFAEPAAPAHPPFLRDVWLDGIQVMVAREADGSDRGLFLAAKGGHNAESHNHNDIGSFVVYADGCPLLVDAGVETYTAKTFSAHRYEIWTMQSGYHNLPTVRGVEQAPGKEFAAREVGYHCTDDAAEFTLDIAAAYPAAAGITRWQRTCRLQLGADSAVDISDAFTLTEATDDLQWSLLCAVEPQILSDTEIVLRDPAGPAIRLTLTGLPVTVEAEAVTLTDVRLLQCWQRDILYRLRLRAVEQVAEGRFSLKIMKSAN